MNKISNLILGCTTVAVLSGCTASKNSPTIGTNDNQSIEVIDTTNMNVLSVLNKTNYSDNLEKFNRAVELVGRNEIKFFNKYFDINSEIEFVKKVLELQSDLGAKLDGVLGQNTLKGIYLSYYDIINKDELPFEIGKRLEAYHEMQGYGTHKGKMSRYGRLYPSSIPNVFSYKYYYGDIEQENVEGTYINKSLLPYINKKINLDGNHALQVEVNGKFAIAYYNDKELKLLSYASPGTDEIDGGIRTRKGEFVSKRADMYYISGARTSISNGPKGLHGAIMPYAVHIDRGTLSHARKVDGTRRSHGCPGLPLFYAKGVFDFYNEFGEINRHIISN